MTHDRLKIRKETELENFILCTSCHVLPNKFKSECMKYLYEVPSVCCIIEFEITRNDSIVVNYFGRMCSSFYQRIVQVCVHKSISLFYIYEL